LELHTLQYLFEVRTANIIGYPISRFFDLIFKIPYLSNRLKKRGSSRSQLKKIVNHTMNNPEYGQSITMAGIQMGGLLVIIEISLFNFLQAIIGKSLIQYVWEDNFYRWVFIISLLVLPGIINNSLLWKKDKYLIYFKEFKKETKEKKRKWAWISFGVVIGVILLLIASFWIMIEAMH
jgi:hypothetical protein